MRPTSSSGGPTTDSGKETWILRGDDYYLSQAVLLLFAGIGVAVLATDSSDQEDFWWWLWIGGILAYFVYRLRDPSRATLEGGLLRFSGIFGSRYVSLEDVVRIRRSDHDWPSWTQPYTRPYMVHIETQSSGKIPLIWTTGVREFAMRVWELNSTIELDLPDGTRLPHRN